jgi:hypothetical protein
MALVLGLEAGKSVFVGDRRILLTKIHNPKRFVVRVDGPMDSEYEITDQVRTEVLPKVFLQAGNTGNASMVKIVIEAPRSMVILREKLYQQGHGQNQ